MAAHQTDIMPHQVADGLHIALDQRGIGIVEDVGDRVTNIGKRTIFIATGEIEEIDISDDEISID